MQRLRELLAHGGIAVLALVFALAFAFFELANAVAEAAVFALQQRAVDEEGELAFSIGGTDVYYGGALAAIVAGLLVALVLWLVWRQARAVVRTCPECLSSVPRDATICRYCTSELREAP